MRKALLKLKETASHWRKDKTAMQPGWALKFKSSQETMHISPSRMRSIHCVYPPVDFHLVLGILDILVVRCTKLQDCERISIKCCFRNCITAINWSERLQDEQVTYQLRFRASQTVELPPYPSFVTVWYLSS